MESSSINILRMPLVCVRVCVRVCAMHVVFVSVSSAGEHLTEAELAEHMCYLFCSPSDYLQLPDDYQPGDAIHTSQEPVGEMLDVGEIIRRVPKDMNPDTFMARFLDMASA